MRDSPFQPWLTEWELVRDGEPFATAIGSRLLPVIFRGRPAILKIAADEEERRGGELMEWYGGVGAAQVFARAADALLMERLTGPRSLAAMARSGEDDEATRILCRTIAALHAPRGRPPPASLVPLETWFRALWPASAQSGGTFGKAAQAARILLASPSEPVVLHGDVHHGNVLDGAARGWLAIDPKGLIGERGFDYANLFRNPEGEAALASARMGRRAALVAEEARLDVQRLLQWVLAYAGLGAAWSLESGDDPAPGLAIAERAAAELGL